MKYAHLKTRCKCLSVIEIENFPPFIKIALTSTIRSKRVFKSNSKTTQRANEIRVFELDKICNNNIAQYLEIETRKDERLKLFLKYIAGYFLKIVRAIKSLERN